LGVLGCFLHRKRLRREGLDALDVRCLQRNLLLFRLPLFKFRDNVILTEALLDFLALDVGLVQLFDRRDRGLGARQPVEQLQVVVVDRSRLVNPFSEAVDLQVGQDLLAVALLHLLGSLAHYHAVEVLG